MFSFLGEGHLGARLCPQQLNLTCWEAKEGHGIRSGRENEPPCSWGLNRGLAVLEAENSRNPTPSTSWAHL